MRNISYITLPLEVGEKGLIFIFPPPSKSGNNYWYSIYIYCRLSSGRKEQQHTWAENRRKFGRRDAAHAAENGRKLGHRDAAVLTRQP